MSWNLFIDDERDMADVKWASAEMQNKYHNEEWTICRSHMQVISAIYENGMPTFISFDHDLGENESTGHAIAKWIVHLDMESSVKIPDNFDFYVHSMNPIGKANIEGLLNGYLEHR